MPNGRLVEEDPGLGEMYSQSVAEQNSVDLAWFKLMSDEYKELRACIYSNKAEMKRFRQGMYLCKGVLHELISWEPPRLTKLLLPLTYSVPSHRQYGACYRHL